MTEETRSERLFARDDLVDGEPLNFKGVVLCAGINVWVFDSSGGAVYVPEDAIAATRAADGRGEFELVYDADGAPLVAVRNGFFCDALLAPATPDIAENIRRSLEEITQMRVNDFGGGGDEALKLAR